MPITASTHSLSKTLEAIGESQEDFFIKALAKKAGVDTVPNFQTYFNTLLQKINDLPVSAFSEPDKHKMKGTLHNYNTTLVGEDSESHLPEQGEAKLKLIGQKTRETMERIISSSDDISQIGFYRIPESDSDTDFPRVVPSSINIQEHLLNQPVPTVRSKSVGVIPNHTSKHIVSIDIIFPSFEIFSSTEEDYPSFINLYNMFKFMPINSIYSSALCTAFVSEYTYPRLIELIGQSHVADQFDKVKGDTALERLTSFAKDLKGVNSKDDLIGILGGQGSELDLGWKSAIEYISGDQTIGGLGYDWMASEYDSGGQDNGIARFPVPVCFKGASLQTLQDMPGAILGRFSFGIVSSPAFPHGTIMYRDEEGEPTMDPNRCKWGKRYVSLASKKIMGQLEIDKNLLMGARGTASVPQLTHNDIRLYYFDIVHGPIVFDTTSDIYDRTETQAPVILEKVSGAFNSKTIDIPLMGSKFPSCQYMGMNSSSFQMIFAVTDKKIISDFMAMKAKIVDAEKSQHMFSSFGIIENPLINSFGITRVTPQSVTIESDPDSPNLYRLIINFVENYQDLADEKLQLEKGAVALDPLKGTWEYFYDLYKIWATIYMKNYYLYSGNLEVISSEHANQLNDLMRAIGISTDEEGTILNPGRGGIKDAHSVPYGPVLMGIMDQRLQLKNNTPPESTRVSGYIQQDLPELEYYPVNRSDAALSDFAGPPDREVASISPRIARALVQIAHGAIRADKHTKDLSSFSVFETQNEHTNQRIFHSPELHQLFYGVLGVSPFIPIFEDEDGDYNQGNIFDYGVDPTENKYYKLHRELNTWTVRDTNWFTTDDNVYSARSRHGSDATFRAKNLVDIWHSQGKILPKPLWDSIFKCISRRLSSKGPDIFVSSRNMDKSINHFMDLISKYSSLYKFNIVNRNEREYSRLVWISIRQQNLNNINDHDTVFLNRLSATTFKDFPNRRKEAGIVAEYDITREKELAKEVASFNNVIIDLYPDLYLPTYSELFNESENVENPTDALNNFKKLLKKFAPKCGDRGVTPGRDSDGNRISHANLMGMTIADISDAAAAGPDEYIDPDIFYYRSRDKQNMAAYSDANPLVDSNAAKDLKSKTLIFPLTGKKIIDKLKEKAISAGNKYELESLNSTLGRGKINQIFKDEILPLIMTSYRSYSSETEGRKDAQAQALAEDLNEWLGEPIKEGIGSFDVGYTRKLLALVEDKFINIEFVNPEGTVIGIMDRKSDSTGYEAVDIGTHTEPKGFNSTTSMTVVHSNIENINAIDQQQIVHMPDFTESLLRSFPTIRLYFIEEDREQENRLDDFYGFRDILECSISSHMYDNDICTMKLSNMSGVLSTMAFSDYVTTKKIKRAPDKDNGPDKAHSATNTQDSISVTDDEGERFLTKIMLRPGIHIMIKMGYGNNIEHLKTVFTGEISEVKNGNIVEIIAQGYQTELQNDFGGFYDESTWDLFKGLLPDFFRPESQHIQNKYSFLDIINYIILSNTNMTEKNGKGMTHLGEVIEVAPYRKGGPWSQKDPMYGYDNKDGSNAIAKILGEDTVQAFLSKGDNFSFFDEYMEYQFYGFSGYDIGRNIYTSISNSSEINITKEWLTVTGPIIDGLREVTRYMPNFIATVVPYQQDATLFIGDPSSVYEYRPATSEEKKFLVKYNTGSADKVQKAAEDRNTTYMQLFQHINRLSIATRTRVKQYNIRRIYNYFESPPLVAEGIHVEGVDQNGQDFDGRRLNRTQGNSFKENPTPEDLDLEELVYGVYYNAISDADFDAIRHAVGDLLGHYLNLSKEQISENHGDLTDLAKTISEFYIPSSLYNKNFSVKVGDITVRVSNAGPATGGWEINGVSVDAALRAGDGALFAKKRDSMFGPSLLVGSLDDKNRRYYATKRVTGNIDLSILNHFREILESNYENPEHPAQKISFESFIQDIRHTGSGYLNSPRATVEGDFLANPGVKKTPKNRVRAFGLRRSLAEEIEEFLTPSQNYNNNHHALAAIINDVILPFKQILLLAHEILSGDNPDEIDDAIRELMSEEPGSRPTIPFNYKVFRDYHAVTTTHDLIANNIAASESDMWSAVKLLVPTDTTDATAGWANYQMADWGIYEGGVDVGSNVFRIDSSQGFASWPIKSSAGMNYRGLTPSPRDITETFTEINSTTPNLANHALTFRIAQGMSKMYRGNIIMVGRNIKPYDAILLGDDVNKMYGTFMAERVIQNFSAVNGWTTTVVPCGLTRVNSITGTYGASGWQKLWYTIGEGRGFETALNIAMLASLFVPILGGFSLAARVVLGAVLRGSWGIVRTAGSLTPWIGKKLGLNAWKIISETAVSIGYRHGASGAIGRLALPGAWQAATSVGGFGSIVRRGAGVTAGEIIGMRFAAGAGWIIPEVLIGKLGMKGGAGIVSQFMNPTFSQSSVLRKGENDTFSVKGYKPAKMELLRYNGAPFVAGLEDMYESIQNHGGWADTMIDVGYMLREFFASTASSNHFILDGEMPEDSNE
jgi:hypothetical protein